MSTLENTLLVVDDKLMDLEMLKGILEPEGYTIVTAVDGVKAWALLEKGDPKFQAVLLDRVMPNMDGMAVLANMKADPTLQDIPVIMITAAIEPQEIRAGIEAGAYYYLGKPFKPNVLRPIVRSAVKEYALSRHLQDEVQQNARRWKYLQSGTFRFRALAEAQDLAKFLADTCPNPEKVVMGLLELLINAVEHGNLQITYEEKTHWEQRDELDEELARRLSLPQHANKFVEVIFVRQPEAIQMTIIDQGKGFEWEKYLNFDPDRVFDSHGRGIAMAQKFSFDSMEYRGAGNEVVCTISLKPQFIPELVLDSGAVTTF